MTFDLGPQPCRSETNWPGPFGPLRRISRDPGPETLMVRRNLCDNVVPNFRLKKSDQDFIVSDQLLAKQSLLTHLYQITIDPKGP